VEKLGEFFDDFFVHFTFDGFFCASNNHFVAFGNYSEFLAVRLHKNLQDDAVFGFGEFHAVTHSASDLPCSAQLNFLRNVVG
jgi:hypothetical protein